MTVSADTLALRMIDILCFITFQDSSAIAEYIVPPNRDRRVASFFTHSPPAWVKS